jgi:hypothetical protein
MKIFKKDGLQQPTKLEARVSKIGTSELVSWAENALYVIGKNITHHQRDHNMDFLYEAELGAEALLAITRELKKRAANEL